MTLPVTRRLAPRVGAVLLLAALGWGCAKPKPAEEEKRPPAPVKVDGGDTEDDAGWAELVGVTQPLPEKVARITAAVEGRVLKPIAGEGDPVEAGQPILQFDDTLAKANFEKTQANVKDLEQQRDQARTAAKVADIEYNRLQSLVSTGKERKERLVSDIEVEKALLAKQDAASKLTAAEVRASAGETELKAAQALLKYYTPSSPVGGRVGQLLVTPGQTVTVGTPLVDVFDLDEIDVLCYVPRALATRLAERRKELNDWGPPARILPSSGSSEEVKAQVVFVAEQAQPETGLFAVKARMENADRRLRVNSVVRVRLQTEGNDKRFVVPESAVMEDSDPPTLFAVVDVETKKNAEGKDEKFGKALKLNVKLGVRNRDEHWVQVVEAEDDKKTKYVVGKEKNGKKLELREAARDGKKEGRKLDLFITEGNYGLKDGDAVKVAEEDEDEKK